MMFELDDESELSMSKYSTRTKPGLTMCSSCLIVLVLCTLTQIKIKTVNTIENYKQFHVKIPTKFRLLSRVAIIFFFWERHREGLPYLNSLKHRTEHA